MTPTTKAGRTLRVRLDSLGIRDPERGLIADAEAEARAALLVEIRREVEELRGYPDRVSIAWVRDPEGAFVEAFDLFALLDRLAAS